MLNINDNQKVFEPFNYCNYVLLFDEVDELNQKDCKLSHLKEMFDTGTVLLPKQATKINLGKGLIFF